MKIDRRAETKRGEMGVDMRIATAHLHTSRASYLFVPLLLVLMVSACVLIASGEYTPGVDGSPNMDIEKAKQLVRHNEGGKGLTTITFNGIILKDNDNTHVSFVPLTRAEIKAVTFYNVDLSFGGTTIRFADYYGPTINVLRSSVVEEARLQADALFVLKQDMLRRAAAEERRFQDALKRAPVAKTLDLPEAARRFLVQATDAIRDKQFAEAIDHYTQLIAAAPHWPNGYFNRALTLSEIADYIDAITDMKRYLALSPDAPDARQVQDKIYEWEAKAE